MKNYTKARFALLFLGTFLAQNTLAAEIVTPQITDAVTQPNERVLAEAPTPSMGNLFQATAQALGNAAHNATTAQQQTNVTAQAATTQGVATLYAIDTASTGHATRKILSGSD